MPIAVQQRAHAVANPHAIARTPITIDDYLDGRWVNEPFRVFDCCYEVDGAVALVVTSAERAADLPQPPVFPLGVADANGQGGSVYEWDDMSCMYSRDAGAAPLVEDRVHARRHGPRAHVRLLHVHRDGDTRGLRLLREG